VETLRTEGVRVEFHGVLGEQQARAALVDVEEAHLRGGVVLEELRIVLQARRQARVREVEADLKGAGAPSRGPVPQQALGVQCDLDVVAVVVREHDEVGRPADACRHERRPVDAVDGEHPMAEAARLRGERAAVLLGAVLAGAFADDGDPPTALLAGVEEVEHRLGETDRHHVVATEAREHVAHRHPHVGGEHEDDGADGRHRGQETRELEFPGQRRELGGPVAL
jgi:hypothetical protein